MLDYTLKMDKHQKIMTVSRNEKNVIKKYNLNISVRDDRSLTDHKYMKNFLSVNTTHLS